MSGENFEDFAEAAAFVEAGMTDANESDESTSPVDGGGDEPAADTGEDTESPEQPDEPEASSEPTGSLSWEEVLGQEIDWSGADRAPVEKLPPFLANLKRAASRELQRAAEERRRWEEANAVAKRDASGDAPQAQRQAAPAEDPEPPYPTTEDDDQTFLMKQRAWTQWNARQAAKEDRVAVEEQVKQLKQQQQQIQQQQQQQQQQQFVNFINSNLSRVKQHPEWHDEIGEGMVTLAEENPEWKGALYSEEGFDRLFQYAKYLRNERMSKAAKSDRAATAAQRTVPRPSTRNSAPKASETPKAESFEDIASELLQTEEFRGLDI